MIKHILRPAHECGVCHTCSGNIENDPFDFELQTALSDHVQAGDLKGSWFGRVRNLCADCYFKILYLDDLEKENA